MWRTRFCAGNLTGCGLFCLSEQGDASMSEITKGGQKPEPARDNLTHAETGTKHGVPGGATGEESQGGYGGNDRLATETAVHPEGGKEQGRDI